MPATTLSLAFVATSSGVKASVVVVFDVEEDEDIFQVFDFWNSGIHPPSAKPEPKSGRNILISGRLERLDTISSSCR